VPKGAGQQLPRAARLRDSRDFQRVNRTGKRRASAHFVVVIAASRAEGGAPKLGLAVSRRVGNAVARNRVKRRVREWFRRAAAELPEATDWVVIARAGAAGLDRGAVEAELAGLAAR
jgi:ribonuclease P protein component